MSDVATADIVPVRRRSKVRVVVWVVGIVVICGMVIAVLLPSLCKPREGANRAKCASNLHQIGLAISLYAGDNGGRYPASLSMLLKEEQLTPAVMVCPSSSDEAAMAIADVETAETNSAGHKHVLSYIYVGKGLTETSALATTIVAYEPLENHQGEGTNVLFGDGHAEWFDKIAWQKMIPMAGGK